MPNSVEVGPNAAEILRFIDFSRWRTPPSWISKIFNGRGGRTASSFQISLKSLKTRPRYVSFNIMLVWLKNAYLRPFLGGFWGTFPPNYVTHRPNPKKDRPWAEPRHLSHKPRKSVARFELGVWMRKKRTGQDRTKKSQKGYISPICGEAPTEAMYMKICVVGDVRDVIMCAKFQNEIFRSDNFTGGRIFHFSYWFWMGLTTVQRYCAACDHGPDSLHGLVPWPFLLSY